MSTAIVKNKGAKPPKPPAGNLPKQVVSVVVVTASGATADIHKEVTLNTREGWTKVSNITAGLITEVPDLEDPGTVCILQRVAELAEELRGGDLLVFNLDPKF